MLAPFLKAVKVVNSTTSAAIDFDCKAKLILRLGAEPSGFAQS
jgi:hypothetical protein